MIEVVSKVAALALQAGEKKKDEVLPLGPARRIEFDTDEATWLSLDDIHNTNTVRYVVKNGEVFEGSTLDRIWPSEKQLRSLWWWTSSPNSVGGVRD